MKVKQVQRIISSIDDEIDFYQAKLTSNESFSSAKESVNRTELNFIEIIGSLSDLLNAKFTLRSLVKEFNAAKIDEKTCKIAELEHMTSFLESPANCGYPREQYEYNSSISYSAGVTNNFQLEYRNKIKKIKRQIQSLKDSCNGINSQGEIDVSDDIMAVLRKYALID